jgi:hypothetical protein
VPVLSRCKSPDCEVLTIGEYCIRHDAANLSIVARQRRWRWDRTPGVVAEAQPAAKAAPVGARTK